MSDVWPSGRSEDELLGVVYRQARNIRNRRRVRAGAAASAIAAATLIPLIAWPSGHPTQSISTAGQPAQTAGPAQAGSHGSASPTGPAVTNGINSNQSGSSSRGGPEGPASRNVGAGASTQPVGTGGGSGVTGRSGSLPPANGSPPAASLGSPHADSVSPPYGPTSGGTIVTIRGAGLDRVTEVLFGTVRARSFVIQSATAIVAVSPAASKPGMVPIGVYDSHHQGHADGGCWTNPLCPDGFLYIPASPPTTAPAVLPTLKPRTGVTLELSLVGLIVRSPHSA